MNMRVSNKNCQNSVTNTSFQDVNDGTFLATPKVAKGNLMGNLKRKSQKTLRATKTLARKLGFSGFAAIASFIVSGILLYSAKSILDNEGRKPSSEIPLELQINKISLPSGSHFKKFDNVFLRISFGESSNSTIEYFREKPISLDQNQSENLDLALELSNQWTQDNKAVFKIEIVQLGLVEQVILRCRTAATELSSYNRSFTCSHPKESSAILSYRLGTKGSQAPGKTAVAKLD